jgi:putative lipoic acid-binding regulatory protein
MMGRDDSEFRETALLLIEKHAGEIRPDDIRSAPSSKGNFVSITITITAESQAQLDNIYHELSNHEQILVAL